MPITLDDTAGAITANTYCSLEDAEAYFATRLHATGWAAADDEEKKAALVMATRHLDQQVKWVGQRTTYAQALEWPRFVPNDADLVRGGLIPSDAIPTFLREATAEQAEFELRAERDGEPSGRGLAAVTLPGPVAIQFDPAQTGTQRVLAETVWAAIAPWALNRSPDSNALRMVGILR